jgi:hypothetical protein
LQRPESVPLQICFWRRRGYKLRASVKSYNEHMCEALTLRGGETAA